MYKPAGEMLYTYYSLCRVATLAMDRGFGPSKLHMEAVTSVSGIGRRGVWGVIRVRTGIVVTACTLSASCH